MLIDEDVVNQVANQQQVLVTAKLHTMNVKLHLGTEPHSDAELQNETGVHSDSKVGVHERDVEIPNRDAHSDTKLKEKQRKLGLN